MPQNLTGNDGSFPLQRAPISGESRTSAGVALAFQDAADRSEHLKSRLYGIDPSGGGARKLRSVSTIAALRALTDLTAGVCVVDGVGLYVYMSSSTITEVDPLVVKPTSVGGGAGRWVLDIYGALDVASGIPSLNASARIETTKLEASAGGAKILGASIVNGIIGIQTQQDAGPRTTVSTSYVDVGAIVVPGFTLAIGDLVVILGQAIGYQSDQTPATHFTQWVSVKPGPSTVAIAGSVIETKPSALNEKVAIPVGVYFTADVAGAHTFKMQQKSEAASVGGTVAIQNLIAIALHIRPS